MGTTVTINITGNSRNAQQVIAQVRLALSQLNQQQARSTREANSFGLAIRNLRNQLFALKLAFEGAQFFGRLISEGLKFNQTVETGTLAVATLITATGRLVDNEGRVLVGTEALAEGMKIAADQVNKLRVDGLRTAATTEQLIDAFQQATAAGIAAGLTLDQIRRTTVQIVLAAGNLGIPMNQLNQEVRSILEATIDRNSRVAKILQITNAEVKANREAGTLAEFLNQKLQAFTVASEKAMDTWAVIKSNMVEAVQVLAGDVTKPFFDSLKNAFKNVLGTLFDFDRAAINKSFSGLVEGGQTFFAEFGRIVEQAISSAVRGAQSLSEWFRVNRTEVQLFVGELGETFRAIGSLIGQVVKVLAGIVKWGIESGTFNTALNVAQTALKIIEKLIGVVIVGQILKATGVAKVFAAVFASPALIAQVRLLSSAWRIAFTGGFLKPIGMATVSIATMWRAFVTGARAALISLGPIGGAIAAIGVVATVYAVLQSRQDKIIAQKEAMLRQMAAEKGEITDLSTQYVELGKNILNGTSTNQDMVSTMRQMAAVTDDIAKKDAAFSAVAQRASQVLRVQASAIEANVRARENLSVEQQKLEGQLTKADLKAADRIRIQNRLKEITGELSGLQRVYTGMVRDSNQAIQENIDLQFRAAEARVAAAEGEQLAAKSILASLEQRKQALEVERQSTTDLSERGRLGNELLELERRIQRYRDSMRGFSDATEVARTALNRLQSEIAKGAGVRLESIGGSKADTDTARNKAENDLKQTIEAQIKSIQAGEKKVIAELERARDANEIGVTEYHNRLIQAELDTVARIIPLRQRLANALSDPGERQQQLQAIQDLYTSMEEITSDSNKKRLKDTKDLKDDELRVRQEWLEATGQLAAAAAIEIERKFNEMIARMRANGSNEVEIALQLKNFAQVKAGIDQLFLGVERGQQQLDTNLANIQARVAAGALAPIDAQREIINQYQQMQGVIDGVRAKLLLNFAATKDPSVLVAIQVLTEKWNENSEAISRAKEATQQLQLAMFDAVINGFEEFLTGDHITKLNQYDTAFRNMALSIVRSIQQMIAQIIAFKAASAIFGAFGFSAPAATNRFGLARGGYITGPGTSTSDSIPARLSHGEYVLSARTVRQVGVNLLDQLNFGASRVRLRKKNYFAQGGLVEGEAQPGARGELTATIGLEDGLVAKHIGSSSVRVSLLKVVSKNPKAFRAALGLA